MKTYIEICIFLFIMMADGCFHRCDAATDDNPIQVDVAKIHQALLDEEIGQIEIVHIPVDVMTVIAVTPKGLEEGFDYRLTIRSIPRGPFEKGLVDALKTFRVQPISQKSDLRWGIIIFDNELRRIGAIYFGRTGNMGMVNNTPMSCNDSLLNWLVSSFSCCFGEANGRVKKLDSK